MELAIVVYATIGTCWFVNLVVQDRIFCTIGDWVFTLLTWPLELACEIERYVKRY